MKATITLRRNLGVDAARMAIAQAGGKASMDRSAFLVAQMILTEKDLLADRASSATFS
jgi:CHASE3 domain sensor protein